MEDRGLLANEGLRPRWEAERRDTIRQHAASGSRSTIPSLALMPQGGPAAEAQWQATASEGNTTYYRKETVRTVEVSQHHGYAMKYLQQPSALDAQVRMDCVAVQDARVQRDQVQMEVWGMRIRMSERQHCMLE